MDGGEVRFGILKGGEEKSFANFKKVKVKVKVLYMDRAGRLENVKKLA
jgi:hypothetical protein